MSMSSENHAGSRPVKSWRSAMTNPTDKHR
jgi:hypothetical protein